MVENSDKTWSTGEGNGKPLQYSYLENPKNSMKRGVGGKSKKEEVYIHIADSLHCTAETNTTLYSNYTPIVIIIKPSHLIDQNYTKFSNKLNKYINK